MQSFKVYLPWSVYGQLTNDERAVFEARLIGHFGGFSRFDNCLGAWKEPSGAVVYDHNVVYEVTTDDPKAAAWFLREKPRLEREFQQQEVWITVSPIQVLKPLPLPVVVPTTLHEAA